MVGKAACEDLCISGTSFNCSTGPMSNFYDKTRVAGGSSSGCALLVKKTNRLKTITPAVT